MNIILYNTLVNSMVKTIYGKKVPTKVVPHLENAGVFLFGPDHNRQISKVVIGTEALSSDRQTQKIIHRDYPITTKYNMFLFIILHEIGHSQFKGTSAKVRTGINPTTPEQYRKLPQEKFADRWAANYMKKNETMCKLWSKALDKCQE